VAATPTPTSCSATAREASDPRPVILVTGATGNIGSRVVRDLVGRGLPVRAFVRDVPRARALLGEGVEFAQGELSDRAAILRAADGVDTVFLACGNGPRQVEFETNAIAVDRRIVKLSAAISGIDSPLAVARWHGLIEERLRASGVPAVVLRPGFFMSNLAVRPDGTLRAPAGTAAIPMIDPRDVAACAVAALVTLGLDGSVYRLTGPAALTHQQVADELSVVTGRPAEFVDLPPEVFRAEAADHGLPGWLVDHLVELFELCQAGGETRTTDAVRELTGREPGTFAQFARDHFRGGRLGL
jgi:uncharacterized protein YbjT (DUF2867 family)